MFENDIPIFNFLVSSKWQYSYGFKYVYLVRIKNKQTDFLPTIMIVQFTYKYAYNLNND